MHSNACSLWDRGRGWLGCCAPAHSPLASLLFVHSNVDVDGRPPVRSLRTVASPLSRNSRFFVLSARKLGFNILCVLCLLFGFCFFISYVPCSLCAPLTLVVAQGVRVGEQVRLLTEASRFVLTLRFALQMLHQPMPKRHG